MRLADTSALVEAVLRASNADLPLAVDLQSVNKVWDLADGDRGYAMSAATEKGGTRLYEQLCGGGEIDAELLQQLEANMAATVTFAKGVENSFDSRSPVMPSVPEVGTIRFNGSGAGRVRSSVVSAAFYAAGIGELPTAESWERTFKERCALLMRRQARSRPSTSAARPRGPRARQGARGHERGGTRRVRGSRGGGRDRRLRRGGGGGRHGHGRGGGQRHQRRALGHLQIGRGRPLLSGAVVSVH